ncbi:monovalent cation/H+ antiporter complex subunit F [Actinobaculum massiliense]|uniref:monovalent cation/H+ antiporter complex subunit F n=1 Tax=Actinobaculum massiliense TaxID=202789 RepID=UPI002889D5BA|nr:monovalent cation/H+ antiporter complex subunit F [Actinobaculum massiliense]
MSIFSVVIGVCAVMLGISAVLVIVRIQKGPTALDRINSLDVIASIMMGAIALLAAVTRRADLLAVFVVVAVVGFLGSVTVARFTRPIDPIDPRELRKAEAAADSAEDGPEEEDAAPAHNPDVAGAGDDGEDDELDDDVAPGTGVDVASAGADGADAISAAGAAERGASGVVDDNSAKVEEGR